MPRTPHAGWLAVASILTGCGDSEDRLRCGEGTQEQDGECVPDDTDSGSGTDSGSDTGTAPNEEDCSDGVDNDEDGQIDCADLDCSEAPQCDMDEDGYTEAEGDCNDHDPDVSPEGNDGLLADRNCDGQTAEGTLQLAEYAFLGKVPGDYAGYWVAKAGDVDGDGLGDVIMGAYDAAPNGEGSGEVYLVLGSSLEASGEINLSEADYTFQGEGTNHWAGIMVEAADVDGDGLSDLLIGAYGETEHGPLTGAVYVVLAKSLGSPGTYSLAAADYKILGEERHNLAGYAVAGADVDADGLDDLLIGASGHDTIGVNTGAAYVVLGSSLGAESTMSLSEADYRFTGETPDSWAGYQIVSAGDVDGDGQDDILLGADDDDGGWEAHAAYLILASSLDRLELGSSTKLSEADYKFVGEHSYDWASQISSAGDVDGDGLADLIIGAAGEDTGGNRAGAAYLILGSSLGAPSTSVSLSDADYKFVGEQPGAWAGAVVSDAGDIDGDGLSDVLVGAFYHQEDYRNQGATYVILGKQLGIEQELSLSDSAHRLIGVGRDDYAGCSVAGAGDVDGDGLEDVLIGGYRGPEWTGVAYLVTGG